MKVRKIIIILIIINILAIGSIYFLIKKDYLNNEKIIVKAMAETEYENYITSLNQSHIDYANYIEESKTKIASAITDMGVSTSNETTLENMASNIRNIARDASLISYDNSSSNLTSTNVQGAVDELNDSLEEINLSQKNKIQYGTKILPSISGKGNISVTITFDEEFENIPQVITSFNCGNYNINSRIDSVTKTDFTMTIFNADSAAMGTGSDRQLNWFAISN